MRRNPSGHTNDRARDSHPPSGPSSDSSSGGPDSDLGAELVTRPRRPASHKIMDLIARRDHSELELRRKLQDDYTPEEIENALEMARESRWLAPPEELAERVAMHLGRRRKGHRYIDRFLRSKGLPAVARDLDEEVEKGLALIRVKLRARLEDETALGLEEKKKIQRLLANRGFDDETIRRVIDSLKKRG